MISFNYGKMDDTIHVFADSDFAGCKRTRRSTSGGAIMWNNCLIKSWSKTQATIALSTGEAELCSLAKASAEGLGIKSILQDWGINCSVCVHTDATAAIGIASRQGLGRIRHIATTDLSVQQRFKCGDLSIEKILGDINPSDLMTKPLDARRMRSLLNLMNAKLVE